MTEERKKQIRQQLYNKCIKTGGNNQEILGIAKHLNFKSNEQYFASHEVYYFEKHDKVSCSSLQYNYLSDYTEITLSELRELVKEEKIVEVPEIWLMEIFRLAKQDGTPSLYLQNIASRFEEQFPQLFKPVTYKVGQKFELRDKKYLLVCSATGLHNSTVGLVSLNTGNFFYGWHTVLNPNEISSAEFHEIANVEGEAHLFKLIE